MLTIDKENIAIEIKEIFTFDNSAKTHFDDIVEELKSELECSEKNEISDYDEKYEFIDYIEKGLTKEDKLNILDFIKNRYETEVYSFDYNVSIFDEDIIKKGISDWIYDNFNFEY